MSPKLMETLDWAWCGLMFVLLIPISVYDKLSSKRHRKKKK